MIADSVEELSLLRVTRYDEGTMHVLELHGECDLATRPQLQAALARELPCPGRDVLVLDLSWLDFCDVGCARAVCEAGRHGQVAVAGPARLVLRVFDLLDPDRHIPRYRTMADAVRGASL